MSLIPWKMKLAVLAAVALAGCGGGGGSPTERPLAITSAAAQELVVTADAAPASEGKARLGRLYIVEMAGAPVTEYDGSVKGYAATKPSKGQKIDPDSPQVSSYMAYLAGKHDAAIAAVGGAKKAYSYGYVYNGFAAELTAAQAQKLAQMPGVIAVAADEVRSVDTASTPNFLGLTGATGVWATKAKGEGVIIGIIDTGIWPEHPSFSDRTDTNGNGTKDGKRGYQQIPGWHGKCVSSENFNASDCNQKLIGARYYNSGFGGNAGIDEKFPFEFNSPRDWAGHGSHTASTAGGNEGVQATGVASNFGRISGIAPRARIAVYKVCWADQPTGGGCSGVDSIAAIDQAVADGVDVLNYSISGSSTNFRDGVEIAFMRAAAAGVFVAASAGNSGPSTSTVAHPGPWLTTVAAGTHDRSTTTILNLGNGASYTGTSVATSAAGPAPLIRSADAGLPGANATALALCYVAEDGLAEGAAAFDLAKTTGKIVVCDRGINARVSKSLAVARAGGVGMVLTNTSAAQSLVSDFHSVPTVHLASTDRAEVHAYAQMPGATATIQVATIGFGAAAPFTATFSSRGPLQASSSLIKPDLIAPGDTILAAVAPPNNQGRLFDIYSGTSMSSPHVAGLAALFKEANPTWSPMMIKSALMTTGYDVLDPGISDATRIFRQGAGHVAPAKAFDPGLVFDSSFGDWLGFLCGTQLPVSFCADGGVPVLNPSNLNLASIAMGAMPGAQTVKRTVTNVGNSAATYTAAVTGLVGLTVSVSPSAFTIAKGGSQVINITATNVSAALGTTIGGQLTLSDGTHKVRLPMVVRPVLFAAPAAVSGSYNVAFGYTGPFTATARGLVPAAQAAGAVALGGDVAIQVVVPTGASYARFSLFNSAVSQAGDLDLVVVGPSGAVVGSSGGSTSDEEVNLANPAPGTYIVHVQGYAVPSGSTSFTLFSWALGTTAAGNMTVSAPASATLGATGTINLSFNSLVNGTKYLGSVVYGGTAGLPAPTIVRVDP